MRAELLSIFLAQSDHTGPIVLLSAHDNVRSNSDLDRLVVGPASSEELTQLLVPYAEGVVQRVTHAGISPASPTDIASLGEDEALFLPAKPFGMAHLTWVVEQLLEPETGCPWDLKQTHESLKKHLLEEAYELFEAIDQDSESAMFEELGDVLLQPLMHAEMARRRGQFDIQTVAEGIADKLVRRHPHVFGDVEANDAETVLKNWDRIKRSEKQNQKSILDGIPRSAPALVRALDISRRAARSGFEWPNVDAVFAKLDEERSELSEAIQASNSENIESECGDYLFTVVNVCRWLDVDPEDALRKMLNRFTDRFQWMESQIGRAHV